VVAPNHPFARRESATIAEAGREPFLFFQRNSSYHGLVYSMFLRVGVVPESAMELDDMETTKHMVEAGLGIAILPEVSIQRELASGALSRVRIQDMELPAQREMGVHLLRNYAPALPVKDFLKMITTVYGVTNQFEERRSRDGREAKTPA
jgi:DNA-binding transcriptional LysR family regulator